MFITSTNENHFQFAQYGYYEYDLIKEYKLEPAPFMIYLVLKDRLSLSIKNKKAYHDHKGYFINYSQTSLGSNVQMTPKTVAKWMNHLKEKGLIDFDHDKVGKSYKIRIVAYDIKHKRKTKTYNEECFDLDKAVKELTAEKNALMDEKIALMDEVNKLNKQIELKKRCLNNAENNTGVINNSNNNITDVPMSTSVKNTEDTPVISTDELTSAITSILKTSIYPSILKGLENTIKDTISQELKLKHDGLMDKSTPVESKPLSEQYDFVSKYYRDTMSYYDLLVDRDSTFCRIADTFFDNIMDMHFSSHIVVKGVEVSRDRVRAVLSRMSYFQMEDVINEYKNLTIKVKDHNTYIKSMIYNSILSFDAKNHNDYKHGEAEYYKKLAEQSQSHNQESQYDNDFWDNLRTSGF